jgi:hypothetical protein
MQKYVVAYEEILIWLGKLFHLKHYIYAGNWMYCVIYLII